MRKILLLASAVCFAATSVSAFEFNPYVAAKAKYALSRNEVKATGSYEGKSKLNDDVWGGSLAVGNIYGVASGDFRIELEYTKNDDAKKQGAKVILINFVFSSSHNFH